MKGSVVVKSPRRIQDLIQLRNEGKDLILSPSFEIVPVYFTQAEADYQAYIFLCRYSGFIDGKEFSFRKCYARGCPRNQCPHVAQAVMIANRYLKRDYATLDREGIVLPERLFSLNDMIVKFEDTGPEEAGGEVYTLHDYIFMAAEGALVQIGLDLELVPAVEHFGNYKNQQTFLMGNFHITAHGKATPYQQCFACYETQKADAEKPGAVATANQRLEELFEEFEAASISHEKKYFH